MSTYITCVGRCRYDGFAVDLYVSKSGTASLRPSFNAHTLPREAWMTFESEEAARDHIDEICGDLSGVLRLKTFLDHYKYFEEQELFPHFTAAEEKLNQIKIICDRTSTNAYDRIDEILDLVIERKL